MPYRNIYPILYTSRIYTLRAHITRSLYRESFNIYLCMGARALHLPKLTLSRKSTSWHIMYKTYLYKYMLMMGDGVW